MQQRVSLITLGVGDLERSRTFYEHLGWIGQEVDETVFFQAGGQAVVLWGRGKVAADAGVHDDGTNTFAGIVLAHNVDSREEVDEVISAAASAGGEVTKAPGETFYGGYAGFFRDPDGHVWEIAHNPGFTLDLDGTLTLPNFGSTEWSTPSVSGFEPAQSVRRSEKDRRNDVTAFAIPRTLRSRGTLRCGPQDGPTPPATSI